MARKFPISFTNRGTVKLTDKLLISNIDTGETQITTPEELLKAISLLNSLGVGTVQPKTLLGLKELAENSNLPTLGIASGILSIQSYGNNYGLLSGVKFDDGNAWLQVQRTDGSATAYNLLIQPVGGKAVIGSNTGENLRVIGDQYVTGNVSADSFTDRTPYFDGNAIDELMKIKGNNGKIDHESLPDFVRVKRKNHKYKYENIVNEDGIKDIKVISEEIEETTERDLGAMITLLTKAIQEIAEKIELTDSQPNKKWWEFWKK